jgi:hypothetical protein
MRLLSHASDAPARLLAAAMRQPFCSAGDAKMTIRAGVIGLLGLQGLWTATVVSLYFVRPDELPILDGPLTYPTLWRTALAETSRAVLGALIVLLAGRGAAAIVPERLLPFEHGVDRVLVLLAVGLVGLSLLSHGAAYAGIYTPPSSRPGSFCCRSWAWPRLDAT